MKEDNQEAAKKYVCAGDVINNIIDEICNARKDISERINDDKLGLYPDTVGKQSDLVRYGLRKALYIVEDAEKVEIELPKHGYWTEWSASMMECSVCHRHVPRHKYEYCPHCGALMATGVRMVNI